MSIDVSINVMLKIFLDHALLVFISAVLESLFEVHVALLEIRSKLTIIHVKLIVHEGNIFL